MSGSVNGNGAGHGAGGAVSIAELADAFDRMLFHNRSYLSGPAWDALQGPARELMAQEELTAEEGEEEVVLSRAELEDENDRAAREAVMRMCLFQLDDPRVQRAIANEGKCGEEVCKLVGQRVLALFKNSLANLIEDASLERIATWCGDGGRATAGARCNRAWDRMHEEAGYRTKPKAPHMKSEEAVEKYSQAQKGNRNRSKGRKRKG